MIRLNRGEEYLLTSRDKWQIEVLQEAGYLLEDIQKEIEKRTGEQAKEIAKNYVKSGQYRFDVIVLDSVTNAQEVIQQGICDGLAEAGVYVDVQISYSYQQLYEYIVYNISLTIN